MTRMRIVLASGVLAATAATVLATSPGTGAAPAASDPAARVDTGALLRAVTVDGILRHEQALQRIADENDGTRASGTPGYDASAAYVQRVMERAGYRVRTQSFTFPFYRELSPSRVAQISPTARTYESRTLDFSASGTVTGLLVPTRTIVIPPVQSPGSTESGCTPGDFLPASPQSPQIALVQRGFCDYATKVSNAAAAGYDAVIIFNEGQDGRTDVPTGSLDTPSAIPATAVSYADGAALFNATQAGPVTVEVATDTETDAARTTTNVIADSRRGEQRGEPVVVGAHLDSVLAGPGINDNGSGVATLLEIARQMADLGLADDLQRRARFAFWGAEENGLRGSEHYVDTLPPEGLARIHANLNFDMLGSPNYVRFVYDGDDSDADGAGPGPAGSAEIEDVFTDYLDGRGLASEGTDFDGRSDYGPFIAAGIPAGGLFSGAEGVKTVEEAAEHGGTAGQPYDACYHQACDDLDNLGRRALRELGDAAAHAVAVLTLSRADVVPQG